MKGRILQAWRIKNTRLIALLQIFKSLLVPNFKATGILYLRNRMSPGPQLVESRKSASLVEFQCLRISNKLAFTKRAMTRTQFAKKGKWNLITSCRWRKKNSSVSCRCKCTQNPSVHLKDMRRRGRRCKVLECPGCIKIRTVWTKLTTNRDRIMKSCWRALSRSRISHKR